MQFKDVSHEPISLVQARAKRIPLHIDPTNYGRRVDGPLSPDSAISSSSSAVTVASPLTPLGLPSACFSSASDFDVDRDPSSGPHRSRPSSTAGPRGGREREKQKHKRSRVTPEQLVQLERYFANDRSPTGARRREISEHLGMQERQTQIWFQNRRAKAKLQDGKQKRRGGSAESPPDTPPQLSSGFEADLHSLIHESEPVTIVPCAELVIGSWRRMAATSGKHDLVAYVCDAKRCLVWFVYSAGFGFKMEIPFDHIIDTEFTNPAPGSGLATFVLSQAPIFYLENISSPKPDGSVTRFWKQSTDWTEGQQASKVFRHILIGSAVQLAHLLRNLQASAPGPEIELHSPKYRRREEEPPLTPLELPAPPMAGLGGVEFQSKATDDLEPLPLGQSDFNGSLHSNNTTSADQRFESHQTTPSYTPFHLSARRLSYQQPPVRSDYALSERQADYGSVAISHSVGPRSFSAQQAPRNIFSANSHIVSPYPQAVRRYSSLSALSRRCEDTPSPPLLTQPFHPAVDHQTSQAFSFSTPPVISGLPGVLYETEDTFHLQEDVA